MSESIQRCSNCKNIPEDILMLGCDHDLCLNCAAVIFIEENANTDGECRLLTCLKCHKTTELDEASVLELHQIHVNLLIAAKISSQSHSAMSNSSKNATQFQQQQYQQQEQTQVQQKYPQITLNNTSIIKQVGITQQKEQLAQQQLMFMNQQQLQQNSTAYKQPSYTNQNNQLLQVSAASNRSIQRLSNHNQSNIFASSPKSISKQHSTKQLQFTSNHRVERQDLVQIPNQPINNSQIQQQQHQQQQQQQQLQQYQQPFHENEQAALSSSEESNLQQGIEKHYCIDHPEEEILYYCFECSSRCICPECVIHGAHQNHQVKTIKKAFPVIKQRVLDFYQKTEIKSRQIATKKSELHSLILELDGNSSSLKKQLEYQFEELRTKLENKEREIMQICDSVMEQNRVQFEEIKSELEEKHAEIISTLDLVVAHLQQPDEALLLDFYSTNKEELELIKENKNHSNQGLLGQSQAHLPLSSFPKETLEINSRELLKSMALLESQIGKVKATTVNRNQIETDNQQELQLTNSSNINRIPLQTATVSSAIPGAGLPRSTTSSSATSTAREITLINPLQKAQQQIWQQQMQSQQFIQSSSGIKKRLSSDLSDFHRSSGQSKWVDSSRQNTSTCIDGNGAVDFTKFKQILASSGYRIQSMENALLTQASGSSHSQKRHTQSSTGLNSQYLQHQSQQKPKPQQQFQTMRGEKSNKSYQMQGSGKMAIPMSSYSKSGNKSLIQQSFPPQQYSQEEQQNHNNSGQSNNVNSSHLSSCSSSSKSSYSRINGITPINRNIISEQYDLGSSQSRQQASQKFKLKQFV